MSFFHKPGTASADYLSGVAFFEGFSDDELKRVAALSSQREVAAGSTVIDQGDAGLECFVIVEGTVSVYVASEHIATLQAGSMMGEMALVDHRPRSASVVADGPVKLLSFDAPHFKKLLEEMPKASERVMNLLTARMQRRN